jgi:hypothetical protein
MENLKKHKLTLNDSKEKKGNKFIKPKLRLNITACNQYINNIKQDAPTKISETPLIYVSSQNGMDKAINTSDCNIISFVDLKGNINYKKPETEIKDVGMDFDTKTYKYIQNKNMENFIEFSNKILKEVDFNKPTYVACQAGMSRSLLLASCLQLINNNTCEINEDTFKSKIQQNQDIRYTEGFFEGQQISKQFSGEVSNDLKTEDSTKHKLSFMANNKTELEKSRLISIAKNGTIAYNLENDLEFSFQNKLIESINTAINKKHNKDIEMPVKQNNQVNTFER